MAGSKKPPSDAPEGDEVLEFTPEDGAEIEEIADMIIDMMEDYGMDCEVHFPKFTMEVAQGVTAEEIIEGYKEILTHFKED